MKAFYLNTKENTAHAVNIRDEKDTICAYLDTSRPSADFIRIGDDIWTILCANDTEHKPASIYAKDEPLIRGNVLVTGRMGLFGRFSPISSYDIDELRRRTKHSFEADGDWRTVLCAG